MVEPWPELTVAFARTVVSICFFKFSSSAHSNVTAKKHNARGTDLFNFVLLHANPTTLLMFGRLFLHLGAATARMCFSMRLIMAFIQWRICVRLHRPRKKFCRRIIRNRTTWTVVWASGRLRWDDWPPLVGAEPRSLRPFCLFDQWWRCIWLWSCYPLRVRCTGHNKQDSDLEKILSAICGSRSLSMLVGSENQVLEAQG